MDNEQPNEQTAVPQCHLWRMPQEIIDMIVDMAYAHKSGDCIKTIRAWNDEEIRRKKLGGHTYQIRPFKPKVDDFLVSKAFFALSAKAWFSVQTWEDGPTHKSSFFRSRLFYEYGTYVERPADSRLEGVVTCPRLHTAHIGMTTDNFDELILQEGLPASEQKLPWIDKLEAADFEKLKVTAALKKASGLREFSLRPVGYGYTKSDEDRQIWKDNVHALEEYVRPIVTGPKKLADEEYPKDCPRPLYAGSRVCWDTSDMLPEDFWKERSRAGGPFQVIARYKNLEDREVKAKELSGIYLERMLKLGVDADEMLRLAIELKNKEQHEKEEEEQCVEKSMVGAINEQCSSAIHDPTISDNTSVPSASQIETSSATEQSCDQLSTTTISTTGHRGADETREEYSADDKRDCGDPSENPSSNETLG
ncbi:Hypothetical predicted protein [Lecanosticta acicola]|uniref:Uncharacterized protein n=1 Tax=Lecanosticta acicola TaxID=111012 RepID=A0AAI8YT99_9PEZI|nr:Hypothetical predicted protein [Lecanosticta acicola]